MSIESTVGDALEATREIGVVQSVPSLRRSMGGPSRSVTGLCDALARTGVRVALVTQGDALASDPLVLPEPISARLFMAKGFASKRLRVWLPLDISRVLRRACRAIDATAIHDHGVWNVANLASSRVAKQLGVPLVISPRGMLDPWSLEQASIKKRIAWFAYQEGILRGAAAFVVTSSQEAGYVRKLGFSQPIAIVPNGVDLPALASGETGAHGTRDRVRTALFLSRIHPKKGLPELVRAWRRVRPTDWRVVVAGYDECGHLARVKSLVRESGLEGVFSFPGPVEGAAKAKLFAAADIFILPTFSENFGIVVAEALAHGLPVVTTRATPWEELVSHRCGWWIEPGEASLVEAIRQATSAHPEDLVAMGGRGRELIADNYSWNHVGNAMREFYEWLVRDGRRPSFVI